MGEIFDLQDKTLVLFASGLYTAYWNETDNFKEIFWENSDHSITESQKNLLTNHILSILCNNLNLGAIAPTHNQA